MFVNINYLVIELMIDSVLFNRIELNMSLRYCDI
jgi:hypothetical protein